MKPHKPFILVSVVTLLGILSWFMWKHATSPALSDNNAHIASNVVSKQDLPEIDTSAHAQILTIASEDTNESTVHKPEHEAVKSACVLNGKSPTFDSDLARTLAQEKPELGLSESDLSLVLDAIEQYSAQGEVYLPIDEHGVIRLKGEFEGRNVKSLNQEEIQSSGEAALIYGLWLAYYADAEQNQSNTKSLHAQVTKVEEYLTHAYRLGQTSALSSLNNYFENQSYRAWHLSESNNDPLYQEINARAKAYAELGEQHANHDWVFNDWVRSSLMTGQPVAKNKLGQPRPILSSQEIQQVERRKLDISQRMQLKPRSAQQQSDYEQLKWIRDQRDFIRIFEAITEKCPQLNEHVE